MSNTRHEEGGKVRSKKIVPRADNVSGNEAVQTKVGYKSPPVATRFKKGQSGNPSGRPRRSPSILALIEAELDRLVHVEGQGEGCTMTRREIVAKIMVNKMVGGQVKAVEWFEGMAHKHPESVYLSSDDTSQDELT